MTTPRQWLTLTITFMLVLIATTLLLVPWFDDRTVIQEWTETPEKTFHLVTVEYKSEINGREIEAYRWDPGSIVVNKGDRVNLDTARDPRKSPQLFPQASSASAESSKRERKPGYPSRPTNPEPIS